MQSSMMRNQVVDVGKGGRGTPQIVQHLPYRAVIGDRVGDGLDPDKALLAVLADGED
jgi:hypothetical protein